MKTLPNLHALRVFEAAARQESFTLAAEELGVTQSAVSKQVALLEQHFQRPLFTRFHRRVELTDFGRSVAKVAHRSFQHMRASLRNLEAPHTQQIRLYGDADFVQLWLLPRLADFEARHPDIRVSLHAVIGMDEPPEAAYDCAVIWGRGNWNDCSISPLLRNTVFPVCAPGFFGPAEKIPRLGDVRDHHLIHDQSRFWWTALQKTAAQTHFDPEAGRLYNQTCLCLEAASLGLGVTIGDEVTTAGHLKSGRLIAPFGVRMPSPDAYFLVRPTGQPETDEVQALHSWLAEQAREHIAWFRAYWDKTVEAPA